MCWWIQRHYVYLCAWKILGWASSVQNIYLLPRKKRNIKKWMKQYFVHLVHSILDCYDFDCDELFIIFCVQQRAGHTAGNLMTFFLPSLSLSFFLLHIRIKCIAELIPAYIFYWHYSADLWFPTEPGWPAADEKQKIVLFYQTKKIHRIPEPLLLVLGSFISSCNLYF